MNSLILEGNLEALILVAIILGIIVPAVLFVIGLVQLVKNKMRGKQILIFATIYSIISFGICGGFGI